MGSVLVQLEWDSHVYPSAFDHVPQNFFGRCRLGFSAIFGCQWLASPWPPKVSDISRFAQTSALFKIYPIVLAAVTWGPSWSGYTVVFFIDNSVTAEIINKGRSRSLLINVLYAQVDVVGLHA